MNVGITVLVIIGVVMLSQLLLQGAERRREHRELMARFDKLDSQRAATTPTEQTS
jgi:hypothetical protein